MAAGLKSIDTAVGTVLWAKETWAPYDTDKLETVRVVYRASYNAARDGSAETQGATRQFTVPHHIAMEMSHAIELYEVAGEQWKPSPNMPHWASRPELRNLVVVWVEVRRVQSITEEEAITMGVDALEEAFDDGRGWSVAECLDYIQRSFGRESSQAGRLGFGDAIE